jgi:hypothetical protein
MERGDIAKIDFNMIDNGDVEVGYVPRNEALEIDYIFDEDQGNKVQVIGQLSGRHYLLPKSVFLNA